MSKNVMPIGPNVLVRIMKKQTTIELLPGTSTGDKDLAVIVHAVGTKCSLGIEIGHKVLIADKLSAIVVEQTDMYDAIIIPETAVKAVLNWGENQQKSNNKEKHNALSMDLQKEQKGSDDKPSNVRIPNCS